jgi:hypothetical protein
MDHDPHFKKLIREFFADFLRLFFADWAAKFDLERVEWLDKRVQSDPPDGELHILDLVAPQLGQNRGKRATQFRAGSENRTSDIPGRAGYSEADRRS